MNHFPVSKSALVILLCSSLVFPPVPLAAEGVDRPSGHRETDRTSQLGGDDRILHALNRFTFGPKPGDLEAVKAMGLDRWFEQQLHPESIDQSDLNARLAQFPATQLTPQDLVFRFPTNGIIRQTIDNKLPEPQNAVLRRVYDNEIFRYDQRQQEKQQRQQAAGAPRQRTAAELPAAGSMSAPAGVQPSADGMMNAAGASEIGGNGTLSSKKPRPPSGPAAADPSLVAEVAAMPAEQRVAAIANMPEPGVDAFLKGLKPVQRAAIAAGLTPGEKEYLIALVAPQRVVNEELAGQRLTRDIYSNAQLLEVMTDFWLNHFNVYLHKNDETPAYLVSYERDVIRPRALGKFEDLLEATAHSPAMLLYLDNASSMGPDSAAAEKAKMNAARHPGANKPRPEGLNENYARELMELHTLGVNGGYTQADVTQVARILTGWTIEQPQRGGGFRFDATRHEPGAKKVLGRKFKENGEEEGRQLLHMLATSPATARFLSRKLAIRFVGDDPSPVLVDRLAKSYLASGGDISKVLQTLYRSPEFWNSGTYRNKVKTPLEFIVSAARASSLTAASMEPLVNALRDMGMPLYGAVPPTGYNWQASAWVGTGALVNRMNFALSLAASKLNGIAVTWTDPADSSLMVDSTAPDVEEQRLESRLVAGGLSDQTRKALLDQFNAQSTALASAQPPQNQTSHRDPLLRAAAQTTSLNQPIPKQAANSLEKQDQLLAGLLLGSPEFQRR